MDRLAYVHIGVIEKGGGGGMDQLDVDGRIPGCIFVGDTEGNPVCRLQSSLCTWNPGKYCSNLTLSTETQDSFHQSEKSPCAHMQSSLQLCRNAHPLHLQ